MNNFKSEWEFGANIYEALKENPMWLETAVNSLAGGIKAALNEAHLHAGRANMAALAALALLDAKRLSAEMKSNLSKAVLANIGLRTASVLERRFAAGVAAAAKERTE